MVDPCPYRAHRPTDWRLRQPNPLTLSESFTCGTCHPLPWAQKGLRSFLDTCEVGFEAADTSGTVQRVIVEHRVLSDEPPTVRDAPTRRPSFVKLRRPTTRGEAEQFARDLGRALDALGVQRGQDFVVLPLSALDIVKPEAETPER